MKRGLLDPPEHRRSTDGLYSTSLLFAETSSLMHDAWQSNFAVGYHQNSHHRMVLCYV